MPMGRSLNIYMKKSHRAMNDLVFKRPPTYSITRPNARIFVKHYVSNYHFPLIHQHFTKSRNRSMACRYKSIIRTSLVPRMMT